MKNFFLIITICLYSNLFGAPPVEPSQNPLETSNALNVKPNLMFILDNSGSMLQDYLGDEILYQSNCKTSLGFFSRNCASNDLGLGNSDITRSTEIGDPSNGTAPDTPFFAYMFNKSYYNPNITYTPGVDWQGNSLGNQSFTSASKNIYQNTTKVNLSNGLRETYFCILPIVLPINLLNKLTCRINGVDTPNPFNYHTEAYPNALFSFPVPGPFVPSYYDIIPTEYCDENLVNCSKTQTGIYQTPAYVRWCKRASDASIIDLVTGLILGGNDNGRSACQKNYDATNGYIYPKYGLFRRVTIPASQYTNYANWYTYYRTRILAMKTSTGLAFKNIDNNYRVGFITINPGNPVQSAQYLGINDFNNTQKQNFYTKLYAITPSGDTPLREALSRVGRYYGGKTDGINSGMINVNNPDPIQYSCQQNVAFMATDGYWNGNEGKDLSGNNIGNIDNVNSGYSTRAIGAYDGGVSGASGTLADVSLYYYQTDLRPSGSKNSNGIDVSENNVPTDPINGNNKQKMNTYMLSFGVNGLVTYKPDYDKRTSPELENIKNGISGACRWTTGVCNWPLPVRDTLTTIDDMWHAAINGRGKYSSIQDSQSILNGMRTILNNVSIQLGSSSNTSISSPQITTTENKIFSVSYRNGKWDGEIISRNIDPATGELSTTINWSAKTQLEKKVSTTTDSRKIYYIGREGQNIKLKDFIWNNLESNEQNYFSNLCSTNLLSQCATLNTTQKNILNSGNTIINWIRGQSQYEELSNSTNPLFRSRDYVLSDIIDSNLTYVAQSKFNWSDNNYQNFINANINRTPQIYVGANNGMLHAIDPTTGEEKWAIIPRQLLPRLYYPADISYSSNHKNYINGTISVMDTFINNEWKTILISGLGSGGKGYFAIDITNPASPKALWEICNSSLCSTNDSEMGYSFGNPIITKRAFDNKWVAYLSAGFDNSTGKGLIYEVDISNGSILRKLYTNTGTTTSPAGLSKINVFFDNYQQNNLAKSLYAGDLDGNVWKWNLENNNTNPILIASLKDNNNQNQPITTKIELGYINNYPVLLVGTGKYLTINDYNTTQIQSVYAIKDNNESYGVIRNNPSFIKQNITPGTISSTISVNQVNWGTNGGWFIDLTSQAGERVNIDPLLASGTLSVISNVPGNTPCTAGGSAWSYQINFLNGGATNSNIISQKLIGGINVGQSPIKLLNNNNIKNLLIDASGQINLINFNINNTLNTKEKTSWKEIINEK